jgi:ATP-binding cassette, subfamily B, bacterial
LRQLSRFHLFSNADKVFGTHKLAARRQSLLYLEKLRLMHAILTVILMLGLLAWAIRLWQQNSATAGDVILVCTLGISTLSATRDLAVALVDATQHMARLSEALATLLCPHDLHDHPQAAALVPSRARVDFENIVFRYPEGRKVFDIFSLTLRPGERVGLVGPSGAGKSTLFALLQRFYDIQEGRILIDGQDICRITQASLRQTLAIVPQDTTFLIGRFWRISGMVALRLRTRKFGRRPSPRDAGALFKISRKASIPSSATGV